MPSQIFMNLWRDITPGDNPPNIVNVIIESVPVNDPRFDGFKDLSDVHPNMLREIQEFFEVYKRLEPKKWVKFKEWKNAEEAKKIINYAIGLYRQKHGSKTTK